MMALAATFNGQILASVFKKSSHVPTSSRNFIFRTCSLPSHVIQRSVCCFQCTGRSVNDINLRWKEVEQRYSSPRGLFMCRVQQHDSTSEENKEDISQATLIWRAIKLPIYSVALIPLTVGSAAAYLQTGLFSARRYFMLLASSVFIITWLNLSELPITYTILSASALVGFTTSLILFCSHFHQVEGDKAVGKFSPLVRLGTQAGSKVVKVGVATLYSGMLLLGFTQTLPVTCVILCALTIPVGKLVVSYVEKNHKDKAKIFMAKYYCVRLHALFGVALAAGFVAAKMVARYPVPKPMF